MILYEFYLHFFVNQSCNNFYSAQNKNYYNSALLKNKHTIKVVCNERNRFGETAAISSGTIQIYVDNVLTYTMNIGIFTRSWDPGDSDVKTGSFEIN